MDILFVTAFQMGVAGVAWATFICQGISCILAVIVVFLHLAKIKTTEKAEVFSWKLLGKISIVAIPSILQQSFISIGNIFPSEWDWLRFWSMTAFLSVMLAVLNILPIPGLDGGHALFTLWEMITGRKASEKFLEVMQYIGFAILLALVIYANGNDIYRLFTN